MGDGDVATQGAGARGRVLSEWGLRRRIRLRCRNYLAAIRIVRPTSCSPCPSAMPPGSMPDSAIAFCRCPSLDLYLYRRDAADKDPANRWLRALVIESFAA
jgi:hypothetical protein